MKIRLSVCGGLAVLVWSAAASSQSGTVATVPSAAARLTEATEILRLRRVTVTFQQTPLRDAVDALAAAARVPIVYKRATVSATLRLVTMQLIDVPLGVAFERLFQGTTLQIVALPGAQLGLVNRATDGPPVAMSGEVTGTVRNAKTGVPVRGATVTVDGVTPRVTTDMNGTFYIASLEAGTHTIVVKCLGYARQTHQVAVSDHQTATLEVRLEPTTNVLEQVVVTGTIIPTALKAIPNAITVVTANDIEQRGITHIDQLFRGEVPGLFSQNSGSITNASSGIQGLGAVFMFSRGATAVQGTSAGTYRGTNPIKTYVDGVEMADPTYLSQIDPKSIERIEILAGPQASTIYGSNALNGVMQIFTKRGTTSRPQVVLSLLSGMLQNDFSSALTPQHDDAIQLSGIEGKLSYAANGSWIYIGRWTPAIQQSRLSGASGVRLQTGMVTADASLRIGTTKNTRTGANNQVINQYRVTGLYAPATGMGVVFPVMGSLQGQTLGLTLNIVPASWWSHELVLGTDAEQIQSYATGAGYRTPDDTILDYNQNQVTRRSLRYAETLRIPLITQTSLGVTAGADGWNTASVYVTASPTTLTGVLDNPSLARQTGHNRGAFVQGQLDVHDLLFLTYGLRAEWNPNFGASAEPNLAPRYGGAITQSFGVMTTKIRGSYGRSTRPPDVGLAVAKRFIPNGFEDDYGHAYFDQLANPHLGPEHQQGGEGGFDLYWGTHSAISVTRYNQTVDGLIAVVDGIDSVRSLAPNPSTASSDFRDANGYGYYHLFEYANVASIRNSGWELKGNTALGSLAVQSTYNWTKSRTIGVSPQYRSFFLNAGNFQRGASFNQLPEHTWATILSYANPTSTIAFAVNKIGQLRGVTANVWYEQHLSGSLRLMANRFRVIGAGTDRFDLLQQGYTTTDLNMTHCFSRHAEGLIQVVNLGNLYHNDYGGDFAVLGRQSKIGVRLR